MSKRKIFALILLLSFITLSSCALFDSIMPGDETEDDQNTINNNENMEEYTISWVDYNDNVLEVDANVKKGTIPTYDGVIPQRTETETTKYIFCGWTPNVVEATKDATYKATYIEVSKTEVTLGYNPTFSEDKTTILYGLYPQTHVNDTTLINT